MGKILIIIAILLLLAGGGYYYYQTTQKPAETTTEDTSSSDQSTAPTEEPTPEEVAKDAFTIEIQNGSGIEGEAGKAQELLEGDEFTVDSTANADNYDYEETVIKAGSDVDKAWITQLRETLGKNYKVKSAVTTLEDGDSDSDVVVIVGSFDEDGNSMAPKEETTTAPTPTDEAETTDTPTPTPTP